MTLKVLWLPMVFGTILPDKWLPKDCWFYSKVRSGFLIWVVVEAWHLPSVTRRQTASMNKQSNGQGNDQRETAMHNWRGRLTSLPRREQVGARITLAMAFSLREGMILNYLWATHAPVTSFPAYTNSHATFGGAQLAEISIQIGQRNDTFPACIYSFSTNQKLHSYTLIFEPKSAAISALLHDIAHVHIFRKTPQKTREIILSRTHFKAC